MIVSLYCCDNMPETIDLQKGDAFGLITSEALVCGWLALLFLDFGEVEQRTERHK